MGICHDVEQGLEKYKITKIDRQPTDEDLNLLTKELTNAAGSVATQNRGGEHGHIGNTSPSPMVVRGFWSQQTPDLTRLPLTRTKS
jgi:hypothetical protein